jgi:hypothetical protein
VPIGQEPGAGDFDVARGAEIDLLGQPLEHQRRHVDGDHALADLGSGQRELTGAGAKVDDRGSGAQDAKTFEQGDLLGRPSVLLGVIATRVVLIEMLAAGMDRLLEPPGFGIAFHHRILTRPEAP